MINKNIFSVKKKNVIITGAGRGLGLEIANYFSYSGANVYIFDKYFKKSYLCKNIKRIKCDFINKKRTINLIKKSLKKINADILINCAAITLPNVKNLSQSIKNWEKTININLNAPYLFCKIVGEDMIKKKNKGQNH